MDVAAIEIRCYRTVSRKCPFRDWFNALETPVQVIVDTRLARVRRGLVGDSKSVGGGVFELKIDVGPGYRIYYGREGQTVVILLYAGNKKGQHEDIETAQSYWQDYLRRTKL